MIRRFFDAAPAEPAAAPPAMSIAEMMAKSGVKSEGPDMKAVITPIGVPPNIPEKGNEPTPAEPAKPVEATPATPAEPAKPEPPSQQPEPAKPEPPIAAPAPKAPTLQEVLKQHQPGAILKELGYDDSTVAFLNDMKGIDPKMVGLLQHWKTNNGDLTPYLKALTTDYSKMSAEDVMKHQLQQEYPTASPQQIEALFKREVIQAYNLNSEDEDEKAEGQLLLQAKADKFRATMVANQQNYLIPKPPEPKAAEPDQAAIQQQQQFELYQKNINESSFTKSLLGSKQLVIGEGNEAYKYNVSDPTALVNSIFDENTFANSFFTKEVKPDGSVSYIPDVEKQLFIHAALMDYKGLLKGLADHYKAIGADTAITPLENPKPAETNAASPAQPAPKTAAEAMARGGVYNSGGR